MGRLAPDAAPIWGGTSWLSPWPEKVTWSAPRDALGNGARKPTFVHHGDVGGQGPPQPSGHRIR